MLFNWPTIPDNVAELGSAALRTLAVEIRAERKRGAIEHPAMAKSDHDEWTNMGLLADRLIVLSDEAADEEAAAAAAAEAEAAAEDDDVEVVDEEASTAPPAELASVGTTLSVVTNQIEVAAPSARWLSTGVRGPAKDESFGSMRDLAESIFDAGKTITAGSTDKKYIAKQTAALPAERNLDANPFFNLSTLTDPSLMAAMCAPLTPLYDLSCDNLTLRPVKNGLPMFGLPANRGGFSVYPSPALSAITTGFGQWTSAMDADAEAIKEACQTITCSSPTEYEIYGIYRCLTVKNLVNMTFPEIVAAYLNRLEARWARYAEVLLLTQMGNAASTVDVPNQAYEANVSILSALLNYLGLYNEIERWEAGSMDAWAPRWLLKALQMSGLRRRRTDGGRPRPYSQSEIEASFADVGFDVHWYLDRPNWATPIPNLTTAGTLNFLPPSAEILVNRKGKFAVMDRGELQIGVTGNNIYRLSDDLRKNQFTFFFESFEGLINTDTCPAHILQFDTLCYNGVQVADEAMGCFGEDNPGVGS